MAETDGTPRFRKSKPPGSNKGGRNASNRNTRPNGKSRKRGSLNATLPSGAALDGTALENQTKPEEAAPVNVEKSESTGVIKTMPTVIRAEPAAAAEATAEPVTDALADTHTDLENSGSRSKLQRGPTPATLRGKRPLLASTLRMELTVHRSENSEPQISVRPTPSWTDESFGEGHDGATTLPESTAPRSRKPTTPGFVQTFDDIPARNTRRQDHHDYREEAPYGGDHDQEYSQPQLGETVRRGSEISGDSGVNMHAPRPRRARRPGERTLIMSRRDKKTSSKRDWVFVVMLVAALGLTASMVLSRQAPPEEAVDAATYEDPQGEDEQGPDPFATTLQPYKAKPAAAAAAVKPNTYGPAAQTESSMSASSIQATELRSLPSGAEVVAGNAVVGSTPVRVARGSEEMSYTLRMPGHQPKVVRVGPQSPASIMVELTRNVSGLPPSGQEPRADLPGADPGFRQ